MTRLKRKYVLRFGILLAIASGFLAVGHHFNFHERFTLDTIRTMIDSAGPWGVAVFAAFYLVSALIPFPTTLLSTVSGVLWGEYLGTAITVVIATLASCVPFWLSRVLGRRLVGHVIQKNGTAHKCDRFASKNGFVTVLLMRLMPILPWDVVNYLTGLCGIRFRDYFLASLIGAIPASFTYNLIGSSLGQPINKTKIVIIIGLVAVSALAVVLVKRRQTSESTESEP